MGLMVLVSGRLWAAKAWGFYWTWDPRLTTSMLSVLVYVSYVVLRSFAGDGDAEPQGIATRIEAERGDQRAEAAADELLAQLSSNQTHWWSG